MVDGLVCWRCGVSLADVPLPLARLAECAKCRADLHVCRLCDFFDARVAKSCRETVADEVQDKQRANFCGYFQPRDGAYNKRSDAVTQEAWTQLEALFGGAGGRDGQDKHGAEGRTEADMARERLEALFNSGGNNGGKP